MANRYSDLLWVSPEILSHYGRGGRVFNRGESSGDSEDSRLI